MADHPDRNYYTQSLDKKGRPMVDDLGIPLLDIDRGSNRVESGHQKKTMMHRSYPTGVDIADHNLAELRHRTNEKRSSRCRDGIKFTGMYDTWLLDDLQILCAQNHNVQIHPGRSNTLDFVDTPERFGTVPLIQGDLKSRMREHNVSDEVRLTAAQTYICERMEIPLPVLPLVFEEEKKLFTSLVLRSNDSSNLNFDAMAMDWCGHVNGINIFPKHPYHLKAHHTGFTASEIPCMLLLSRHLLLPRPRPPPCRPSLHRRTSCSTRVWLRRLM